MATRRFEREVTEVASPITVTNNVLLSATQQSSSERHKNIHKIPSHPIAATTNASIIPTIKLNNTVDKVKYSLLNNWIENGFIENMRSQIRCQLIKELRNPFKHQKQAGLKNRNTMNLLSLNQRIMNCIIIDYLTKYSYKYSLSVFKSEIGGELIGSLPIQDTYHQLNITNPDIYSNDTCIIEQIIECNRNNAINTYHQTLEKEQQLILEQKKVEIIVLES